MRMVVPALVLALAVGCAMTGRRVAPGRHTFVVVQFFPQEEGEAPKAVIKKYERQTGTELVLSQYNPPQELRFASDTVKSIHLIVNPGDAR